jgi:hypothetical protein
MRVCASTAVSSAIVKSAAVGPLVSLTAMPRIYATASQSFPGAKGKPFEALQRRTATEGRRFLAGRGPDHGVRDAGRSPACEMRSTTDCATRRAESGRSRAMSSQIRSRSSAASVVHRTRISRDIGDPRGQQRHRARSACLRERRPDPVRLRCETTRRGLSNWPTGRVQPGLLSARDWPLFWPHSDWPVGTRRLVALPLVPSTADRAADAST